MSERQLGPKNIYHPTKGEILRYHYLPQIGGNIKEIGGRLKNPSRLVAALSLGALTSAPILSHPSPVIADELTPTVSLGSVVFNYEIDSEVPSADVDLIKAGISFAQNELQTDYGGDIRRSVDNPMTVKVVATGRGNEELGGKGACCTALDETGVRPFFDVMNPGFPRDTIERRVTVGHEYTHAWQNYLGCLTIHDQPLGDWTNEGIAQYIPIKSLVRTGVLNNELARYLQYYSAKVTGQLNEPLESLEPPGHSSGIWPGHVGYLAVENLVSGAPSGVLSLRTICESVAAGSNVDQAFQSVFGISKSDFYRDFPDYLQSLRTSPIYLEQVRRLPQGAVSWTPSGGAAYELNFVVYGFEELTPDQKRAALIMPRETCGWGSGQLGKMIIALCNASPGTYPVTVEMPDGRRAQVGLVHSN